jgi:WW domain
LPANVMERRPPKSVSPMRDSKDTEDSMDGNATEDGEVEKKSHPPLPAEDSPLSDEEAPLPNEDAPPLPDEPPPLPSKVPPDQPLDDGWEPIWDDRAQGFYFYNRITQVSQWENPRVPATTHPGPPGVANHERRAAAPVPPVPAYNPAIHGDYDPNADYAKTHQTAVSSQAAVAAPGTDPSEAYAATGAFNRFTGKWQDAEVTPERFGDEAKSKRQMNAFFDVDAAANSHDGRSLRAERQQKKLSKQELKAFKEKRREKKEEKRRAWLKD